MQLNARNFFKFIFKNLAMFVYFYGKIIGMKQIFKKRLVIKTQFDPDNPEDVILYQKAILQLNKDGVHTETGTERIFSEFGKKLYFRYSLTTDFIIWIILPLIAFITLIF